jgi:hypothetical protein
MSKRIRKREPVRCMAWHVCGHKDCDHHPIHEATSYHSCVFDHPFKAGWYAFVKYCPSARGYVKDIPLHEIDSNVMCDPNLAFRMKKSRRR